MRDQFYVTGCAPLLRLIKEEENADDEKSQFVCCIWSGHAERSHYIDWRDAYTGRWAASEAGRPPESGALICKVDKSLAIVREL